jgi:hypothetical protein
MRIYLLIFCCFIYQYNFGQKNDSKGSKQLQSRIVTDAVFPGGMQLFYKYLYTNIELPDSENSINGEIVMSCIVGIDGFVTEAKLVENNMGSVGDQIAIEAARVLRKSPKWKPASINSKKIPIIKTILLKFSNP